jgi:hypothetical protein
MANHVYSIIEINFANQEDTSRFLEWIGFEIDSTKWPENSTYMSRVEACSNCLFESLYDGIEETREWMYKNIGAKWCYLDDVDASNDTVYLNIVSAWDFPEGLFYKLSDFLREQYPGAKMEGTFEDEGYCFIGACAANQQYRDIEYFSPDDEYSEDPNYKDEDGCWTDAFFEEMSNKKDELLDEVLSFTEQITE